MLKEPAVKSLITSTNKAMQQAISKSITHEMPEVMRKALQKNVFYFSGMKTHAQMAEASSKLMDDKGNLKPLHQFQEEVKKTNETYNDNYLRAERNFATRSAQTAAKWRKYEEGKDRYDLRYLTDNGPNVRESHSALEFTTLPVDDPFWDKYTPPNGYNCHCFLVQVRKGEYPVSHSAAAIKLGEAATTQIGKDGTNKAEIFRFNPGKEMKVMPPDHPYTSGNCDKLVAVWQTLSGLDKLQLAGQADKCQAKKVVGEMAKTNSIAESRNITKQWMRENIPANFPITFKVKAKYLNEISIYRANVKSILSKGHDNPIERNEAIKDFKKLMNSSVYVGWLEDQKINGIQKHPDTKYWQYYKVKIAGENSFVCVKRTYENSYKPYAILQESEFKKIKDIKNGNPEKEANR